MGLQRQRLKSLGGLCAEKPLGRQGWRGTAAAKGSTTRWAYRSLCHLADMLV